MFHKQKTYESIRALSTDEIIIKAKKTLKIFKIFI